MAIQIVQAVLESTIGRDATPGGRNKHGRFAVRLIAIAGASMANERGEFWGAMPTLGRWSGTSEATARRAVHDYLVKTGLWAVEERPGRAPIYRWNLEMLAAMRAPDTPVTTARARPRTTARAITSDADPSQQCKATPVTSDTRTVIEPSGNRARTRAKPGNSPRKSKQPPWPRSDAEWVTEGQRLGLTANPGEEMDPFKCRVRAARMREAA